jgi:hypothetical protein
VTEESRAPDPAGTEQRHRAVLADLRRYRAYLQQEMAVVLAAEASLGGRRPSITRHPAHRGTFALLRQLIDTAPVPVVLAAPEVLMWLEAHEWTTRARDRQAAVSTALAHLAENGELIRDRQGVYLTLADAAAAAAPAVEDLI